MQETYEILLVDVVTVIHFSLSVIMMGLEETSYTVTEGVDVHVEVCAVLYSPSNDCVVQIPFNISLSTREGSGMYVHTHVVYILENILTVCIFNHSPADDPTDYQGISSEILTFDACINISCTSIRIINDGEVERDEIFYLSLQRISGQDSRVILRLAPDDGQVVIKDRDGEHYEELLHDVHNYVWNNHVVHLFISCGDEDRVCNIHCTRGC